MKTKIIEKSPTSSVYQSLAMIEVSFILEGNKFQDRFLNLGATLSQRLRRLKIKPFDNRFIKYEIVINRIG